MTTATLERMIALTAAENRAIGMIANGVDLPEVLDELCRQIDRLTPGLVTTVLLMDPDGTRLWPGGGPGFPAALHPVISPWPVGPKSGACGTAAFLKHRVIVADVSTDPRWPNEYRALAIHHGLCASWSQPLVTSSGTVLGTFAMYYAEPRVPDATDLELIEAAGQIALIAIQLDRSQTALREGERRFRLVVNTIPVMIWTTDAGGQWTYVNRAWTDYSRRPDESVAPGRWIEGVHPDDVNRSVDVYSAASNRRIPFEMEHRLERYDGTYRRIFIQGVPRFNDAGEFEGYIGSGIDITEQKLAEEALSMVSRRLIAAQEDERTRLARELHDDINQRLALVLMSLDRVQHVPSSVDELRKDVGSVTAQIADIVKDIQALSHRFHSSKLDLLGLTRAAGDLCVELSTGHDVAIDFDAEDYVDRVPQHVSLCLFRVLQEALQNATKHSGARRITVSLQPHPGAIELRIADDGVGFDMRAVRGRGLGLTSMIERLKLVDGKLSIDSTPGGGTTIRATVPVERREHQS